MTLFAMYEMWRPWHEIDTYIAAMVLALLLLLAVFNRGRSFLANGVLIGCALGCVCAAVSEEEAYGRKMGYIESGLLLGLLCGMAAKVVFAQVRKWHGEKSGQPLPAKNDGSQSPAFWLAALAISGISVGLTLAVLFPLTYREMFLWSGILGSIGLVIGVTASVFITKTSWLRPALELWLSITLAAGIGAVFGWKFVFPFVMYDINPHLTDEQILHLSAFRCAIAGGLIGLVAWTVRILKRPRTNVLSLE